MRMLAAAAIAAVCLVPAPAGAQSSWLIPPVDGPIARRFVAPQHPYGPGHRGIDYLVPPGSAVRAAGGGTVRFAGAVAGRLVVSIDHMDGLTSTYSELSEISVSAGQVLSQGQWIGRSERAHDGVEGLHFGLRRGDDYLDPTAYLGAVDSAASIYLTPLEGDPACATTDRREGIPPNDNVAVAIGGLNSSTAGDAAFDIEDTARHLGYPATRTYLYSYRGSDDFDLHLDYSQSDTFGDLVEAAGRLAEQLRAIGRRHPGRDVDLIAHSQGGIIARTMLTMMAGEPGLPHVDHLVTFATPHRGAPLAGLAQSLEGSLYGGAPAQLSPGSGLMSYLDGEDIAYGTRGLALAAPHDVIVPATRAGWETEHSRIVRPSGLMGHSAIVESPGALGLAYDFLRNAPGSCEGVWDRVGLVTGGLLDAAERGMAGVANVVEGVLERL